MKSLLRRTRDAQQTAENPASWMLTFTDMLFLVLTFFVMRFAMLSFPQRLGGPEVRTAPPATDSRMYPLVRKLEEEITHQLQAGPTVERGAEAIRFPAGVLLEWRKKTVALTLTPQFAGSSGAALPFQTASLLKSTAKLARNHGSLIEIRVADADAAERIATLVAELAAAGIEPAQLAGSAERAAVDEGGIEVRFLAPDESIPTLR